MQVLKANLDDEFVSSEVIQMLNNLPDKDKCLGEMYSFYRTCIKYLEKWMKQFENFHQLLGINLRQTVVQKDIQNF